MADDEGRISGSSEAHTPPEISSERVAKIGATRAMAEAALSGLAGELAGAPEADQPSLLLADPDGEFCLFGGPVRHVANIRDAAKRARGRPLGSQNKRSTDLASYLLSMGYRDPAINLADIANATPADLAAELGCGADAAIALVIKANAELLPYFHSKRAQQVDVKTQVMGVMIVGEMPTDRDEGGKVIETMRFDQPE